MQNTRGGKVREGFTEKVIFELSRRMVKSISGSWGSRHGEVEYEKDRFWLTGLIIQAVFLKNKPSFQESWKIMLKQPRPILLQVALKENVNFIALDYTAATQDTRREKEQGRGVILARITSLAITT